MHFIPAGRPKGRLNTSTIVTCNQIVDELRNGKASSFSLRATLDLPDYKFHNAVNYLLQRGRVARVGNSYREGPVYEARP